MAVFLRPVKIPLHPKRAPSLKFPARRIRRHRPRTRILFREAAHYGCREAKVWCEDNGVDYIFGLLDNFVLRAVMDWTADDLNARVNKGRNRMPDGVCGQVRAE